MPRGKTVQSTIRAKDTEIAIISSVGGGDDFISLTDIAKYRDAENPRFIIQNWMRTRSTVEFLGLWESLNNPNFNRVNFEAVKNESGANGFVLTPAKWIQSTNAIGINSKAGRYGGGTFAHSDIAFEFASWVSPEFKLYVIKDYQRLKGDEGHRLALEWNVKRLLAKANYRIHTDAVKEHRISPAIPKSRQGLIYADEADLLNLAVFGKTAAQWRKEHHDKDGNMRDSASIVELLVLTNLENINAHLIEQQITPNERARRLHKIAQTQLKQLSNNASASALQNLHDHPKLPIDE